MRLDTLSTRYLGRHHIHLEEVSSTNDYLKEHAHRLPHGAVATATVQTRGKGRLGKTWADEPGKSLILSALLHGWSPSEMGPLPLLTGLAVCEALREACDAPCTLKWSNDVLLDEKKLCGILCESKITGQQASAVIGLGVNLLHTAEDLRRLDLVYAASLLEVTGKSYEPGQIAANILGKLEKILDFYRKTGFSGELRQRYRAVSITLGRQVRVIWQGEEQTGEAVDVAGDGALICRIGGKLYPIHAGEASVRGIYGYV